MIETGTRWRLARTVEAHDGFELRTGRIVTVLSIGNFPDRLLKYEVGQRQSRSSLPICRVVSGDGRHLADVLQVDLRPVR